jgi:hypothetical protein
MFLRNARQQCSRHSKFYTIGGLEIDTVRRLESVIHACCASVHTALSVKATAWGWHQMTNGSDRASEHSQMPIPERPCLDGSLPNKQTPHWRRTTALLLAARTKGAVQPVVQPRSPHTSSGGGRRSAQSHTVWGSRSPGELLSCSALLVAQLTRQTSACTSGR